MNSRLKLDTVLRETLGSGNVYFQPPESVEMKYPAIVYERSDLTNAFADNTVYIQRHVYQVTVIDKNPDSVVVDKISQLPRCKFIRHYKVDNLNHDVFTICC